MKDVSLASDKKAPIYALTFLANMGYGVVLPGLSIYVKSMGSSYSVIGLVISIYAAAQLVTQVPVGRISDRIGRRLLVTAGFTGVTIAAVLYNFASQPFHFYILQALGGLSMGCVWPPVLAYLTDMTKPGERGKVMGIFNTVFFIGIGLGPLAGGYIASNFGFLAVFNVWAFIAGFGAVFSRIFLKDKPATGITPDKLTNFRTEKPKLITKGRLPTFVAACAVRARGGFCTSFNNAILPLYAVALFDATQPMIGGLMFIHGIMLALFNFPGGVASDRFGRKWPPLYGSLLATGGVLWYAFPGGYWFLFVAVALAGAGAAFATPGLAALVGDVSHASRRGEAFGFFQTSFFIGSVFGASVFGFLSDLFGLHLSTLAWGGFSLALSLCGFIIKDKDNNPNPVPVSP